MEHNHMLSMNANLCISNLEKTLSRQEQKTNEIFKKIKPSQSKQQKYSQGSHSLESVTSPERKTLKKPFNNRHKRQLVDLTKDDADELENEPTNKGSFVPSFSQEDKAKLKKTRSEEKSSRPHEENNTMGQGRNSTKIRTAISCQHLFYTATNYPVPPWVHQWHALTQCSLLGSTRMPPS
jgi:hypothetical protein